MIWRLIIKEFGPNIQHIYVFDNIVADTLSILPSTSVGKYGTIKMKAHCLMNKLFEIDRDEKPGVVSR